MTVALVLDDNRLAADIICHFLILLGIEPIPAYSPNSALRIIQDRKPDIIFLDLMMPGMNGFEVISFLHREPNLSDVPLVMITSDDSLETCTEAKRQGVYEILNKPVTIEDLENLLRRSNML